MLGDDGGVEMSHTPGKWHHSPKLTASENHRGWGIYVKGKWIADVSPMSNQDGDPSDEGYANVALIAAAPDLLAALFAIRDARNTDQDMEAWALAELAMSKATGEPS